MDTHCDLLLLHNLDGRLGLPAPLAGGGPGRRGGCLLLQQLLPQLLRLLVAVEVSAVVAHRVRRVLAHVARVVVVQLEVFVVDVVLEGGLRDTLGLAAGLERALVLAAKVVHAPQVHVQAGKNQSICHKADFNLKLIDQY